MVSEPATSAVPELFFLFFFFQFVEILLIVMVATNIDYNHPLFIGPSDTSDLVIIPIKLTGSNN